MKWVLKDPVRGDMVRVKSGNIYHYGVFVSETEIVQFGLAPAARPAVKDSDVEVCVSNVDEFLCGGFLEVGEPEKKEQKKLRAPETVVSEARKRIGEKGYSILYNNCEHFAYQCVLGEKYSSQTEGLRAFFHSLPIVDVYVAEIPENTKLTALYPPERNREIEACSSEKVKREKYYVWKLLEYALERTFGYKMKKQTFTKTAFGKWQCASCSFSLSHSKNAVAVALSRTPVGVDIQCYEPEKIRAVAQKFLNDAEKTAYEAQSEEEKTDFLLRTWTQKESLFKTFDTAGCKMVSIDTTAAKTWTKKIEVKKEPYFLCVASEHVEKIRLFENIDLQKR